MITAVVINGHRLRFWEAPIDSIFAPACGVCVSTGQLFDSTLINLSTCSWPRPTHGRYCSRPYSQEPEQLCLPALVQLARAIAFAAACKRASRYHNFAHGAQRNSSAPLSLTGRAVYPQRPPSTRPLPPLFPSPQSVDGLFPPPIFSAPHGRVASWALAHRTLLHSLDSARIPDDSITEKQASASCAVRRFPHRIHRCSRPRPQRTSIHSCDPALHTALLPLVAPQLS